MTILTKESDLLKFLNDKRNKTLDATHKHLYYHYNKIINTSILNCYNRLLRADQTIHCLNLVNILFWYLIEETKNIKLSMFLCDRAILLYTEYILMVSTPLLESKKEIDMTEVKIFVYKKTLGPLALNVTRRNYNNIFIKFCYLNTELYSQIFQKTVEKYQHISIDKVIDIYKEYTELVRELFLAHFFKKENFKNNSLELFHGFVDEIDTIKYLSIENYINCITIMTYLSFHSLNSKDFKSKSIEMLIEWIDKKKYKEIINISILDKDELSKTIL